MTHSRHSKHTSPLHNCGRPLNSAEFPGKQGQGQRPGLSPAGDYTLGARPARPQSPGRPCHSSPPPGALLPQGTVSALSQAARRATGLGQPNRGAKEEPARHSRMAGPERRAGPGRAGPKSASRTHLSLRLRAGRTGAQTPRDTSSARAQRAHFAPEVGKFRLAAL